MNWQFKSMFKNILDRWELVFGLLWILWVMVSYLGYHPQYLSFLDSHPYASTLKILAGSAILTALFGLLKLKKSKSFTLPVRGGIILVFVLLIAAYILLSFRQTVGLDVDEAAKMLAYFIGFSLVNILALLFLAVLMYITGSFVTDRIAIEKKPALVSMAFGFSLFSFLIVLLALLSIYNKWVLWPLIILIAFFKRKLLLDTLKNWTIKKHNWKISRWWELPVALLGLVFIAFYWVGSLKAYALGFDGTALYANLAHLLAHNIYMPGAIQPYGWSVIMSLGERLFASEVINLLLSHFMYLPALIMGYHLARLWLKPSYALLAMVICLSMPFMGFHAMVDEKTDLAVLFISLSAIYLIVQWINVDYDQTDYSFHSIINSQYFRLLMGIAWLIGFAFTIKFTTIFLLLALLALVVYRYNDKWVYLATLSIIIGLVFVSGFYEWGIWDIAAKDAKILGVLFLLPGLGMAVYAIVKKQLKFKKAAFGFAAVLAVFVLPYLPWGAEHLSEHNYRFSFNNMLYGKADRAVLDIDKELSYHYNISPDKSGLRPILPLLTNDQGGNWNRNKGKAVENNAKREELQRYVGYEEGLWRYTSIPFDLSFGRNIKILRHQDIGFFFLALLPLLLFGFGNSKRRHLYHFSVALGLILWVSNSYWSLTQSVDLAQHIKSIETINQANFQNMGDNMPWFIDLFEAFQEPFVYIGGVLAPVFKSISLWPPIVMFPLLILMIFGIVFLLKSRVSTWKASFKNLMILAFGILTLWVLLGNSITWYAFPLLIILPILAIYYYQRPSQFHQESSKHLSKKLIGTAVFFQLILNSAILFTSPYNNMAENALFQWPMIEYISKSDTDKGMVHQSYNATQYEIVEEINSHPEAKVFRVNTYLNYHIENNNTRVFSDNQLARFTRLCNRLENKTDVFRVLKNNGYKYILYDFNTPALDQTPEQSLSKKVKEFYRLIRKDPSVSLLITDHYVDDPNATERVVLPNGKKARAKQGLYGDVVHAGSIALFEIK